MYVIRYNDTLQSPCDPFDYWFRDYIEGDFEDPTARNDPFFHQSVWVVPGTWS